MTSQFDFTNNEWDDIATLPVLVGYAVARAEDSGRLGSFRELRTLVHTIAAKAPDNAARSLIEAVSTIDVKDKIDEFEQHSPELLGDIAVRAGEEISRMLADRAEPAEIEAFQQWVFAIAVEVADAAKEHGIRVSAPEAALLGRLRGVLLVN